MKRRYLQEGFIFIIILFIYSGCSSYKVQNVEVDGAPNRNAIKITENREPYSVVANTYLAFNDKRTLSAKIDEHSNVNSQGVYQLDPVEGQDYFVEPEKVNTHSFDGTNFKWNIPSMQGGFELDFALSKHISFWGGLNYSEVNSRGLFGKKFGIGFFTQSENMASRFDLGLRFQDFFYKVEYLEIDDAFNQKRIYYHRKSAKESVSNVEFSFTMNTINKPLDFFLNLDLGNQSFYSFSPDGTILSTIDHSSFSASICFGIFKKLSEQSRIIIGARYTVYDETGRTSLPDFFIQHDLIMF